MRTALRLRPDRLVVGEVRGPEVLALVQALNTGHDGAWSTCHANSSLDALHRLETLVRPGGAGVAAGRRAPAPHPLDRRRRARRAAAPTGRAGSSRSARSRVDSDRLAVSPLLAGDPSSAELTRRRA